MILEYSRVLRFALPCVILICSIAMFWAASSLTNPNYSKMLFIHPYIYSNVTGDTLFFGQSNALFGCVAGAVIGLLTSIMGCAGAYIHSRILYGIFVFFAWIAALAMLVSGALFLNSLPYLGTYTDTNNILQNPDTAMTSLSTAQTNMLDLGISLFNTCCVNSSFVEQGMVGICTGNNVLDCPALTNPLISTYVTPAMLCTCGHSSNSINAFTALIQSWSLCNVMSNVYININDAPVPVLNIPINSILQAKYGNEVLTQVPLVGFHQDPSYFTVVFPNQSQRNAPAHGFGCGFGYMKGLLWYIGMCYYFYSHHSDSIHLTHLIHLIHPMHLMHLA
jgi:hypothetical protein